MRSEALAVAREETRRQISHDAMVLAGEVLRSPVTVLIGGFTLSDYFVRHKQLSEAGRVMIYSGLTASVVIPTVAPLFGSVIKDALLLGAVK